MVYGVAKKNMKVHVYSMRLYTCVPFGNKDCAFEGNQDDTFTYIDMDWDLAE